MARSGSVDFTVTASSIATQAARAANILGDGQAMSSSMQASLFRLLNMMVKQWQGMNDFAPGLKVWTRRRGTLFLQQSQNRYLLGPGGDHATDSYVETTLVSSGSGTGSGGWAVGSWATGSWSPTSWVFGSGGLVTQMTLASTAGISDNDYIGIWLDDGSVHWTRVDGTPSGGVLFLDEEIPSPASAGAKVVAYTNKARRPIEILTAFMRDTYNNDCPLKFMNLSQYDGIRQKRYEKTPESVFFEAQLDNAVLYIDGIPDDVEKTLQFTYLSDIEDIDSAGDTFDYPAPWYMALYLNLAVYACIDYNRAVPPDVATAASNALVIARNQYPENSTAYFQQDVG